MIGFIKYIKLDFKTRQTQIKPFLKKGENAANKVFFEWFYVGVVAENKNAFKG